MIDFKKILFMVIILLSSCASQEDHKKSYSQTVKKFSNNELCFQIFAHSDGDKFQYIRYNEMNYRSLSCASWQKEVKKQDKDKTVFIVPSYYVEQPKVVQEKLNPQVVIRPSPYDMAYPFTRDNQKMGSQYGSSYTQPKIQPLRSVVVPLP